MLLLCSQLLLLMQEELPFAHQIAKYPVLKAPRHVPSFSEQKEASTLECQLSQETPLLFISMCSHTLL